MLPLAQIKVKAAKIRKAKSRKQLIVAADPDKSSFSRDVPTLLKNTSKLIDQTGLSVMDHFHSVLSQSKIGHQSSFGEHINYIYSRESLNNHDYTSNLIFVPRCNPNLSGKLSGITSETTLDAIVVQDIIPLHVPEQQQKMYVTNTCKELEISLKDQINNNSLTIKIDISSLKAPTPFGANYIRCPQRSEVWKYIRKGKVTGSRLPALLGFYGKEKLDYCLDVVLRDAPEKDMSHIINIQRGILYEDEGVRYFEVASKSKTEKAGFFLHPINTNFGASPDALCAAGLLLEVKTRALNADGPLESLRDYPQYFLQCQLQMACTNAHACILLSYHPETETGNFFLVARDSHLMGIIMDVVEAMLKGEVIEEWPHKECKRLHKVGENLLYKKICFETLKNFRSYIKSFCKSLPRVEFTYIDFINHSTQ